MARSLEAAGGADLALLVCDGSRPLEPEDQEAMEAARLARHAVCLLNKQDLPCQVDRSCLPFETVLPVSAKDGTGLEALTPVLEALFGAGTFCDGSVLTNARQADAIRRAAEAMGRARDGLEDGFTRMPSSQMWRRLWRPWESSAAEPFGRTSQTGFLSGFAWENRGKEGPCLHIWTDSATTKPCPEAVAAMVEALETGWGNPSSLYRFGMDAARRLKAAREQVAKALGAESDRVFFTSGGTEADNWAVASSLARMGKRGRHVITTAVEHHAILNPMKRLEEQGYDVTYLKPDALGRVTLDALQAAIRPDNGAGIRDDGQQ